MKWVLTGLSLACVVVLCAADDKWMKIEPKDASCSIEFPGKPKEEMGEKSWHVSLPVKSDTAAYSLQINELQNKAPLDQPDAVKKILDQAQQALMKSDKLEGNKLVKSEDGMFGKYPSRDIELTVPKLGVYRVKLVLTTDKFYQVIVAGPADFTKGDDAKKFYESFKLTD